MLRIVLTIVVLNVLRHLCLISLNGTSIDEKITHGL